MENDAQWCEATILLLKKWERICHYRKAAHYTSAKMFGWKNKLLSIPIILTSTILGSLSFIHPSFTSSVARRLSYDHCYDPFDGNCAIVPECISSCPELINPITELGFYDCQCCHNYWEDCSFAQCNDYIYGEKDETYYDSVVPSAFFTNSPSSYVPTTMPSNMPTPIPTLLPTYVPTIQIETIQPTQHEKSNGSITYVAYIIGGFNMLIAILSALHTFLKYDALEDRHLQYSRHFADLQVNLETLLAKTPDTRGNSVTVVERYKTKYSVLINNAPDLPEKLERNCCASEEIHGIEMT